MYGIYNTETLQLDTRFDDGPILSTRATLLPSHKELLQSPNGCLSVSAYKELLQSPNGCLSMSACLINNYLTR